MAFKAGLLVLTLFIGSNAFPAADPGQDMSIFFDHTYPESRIVGGSSAATTPYMVAVLTGVTLRNLICGGSLVTTKRVLTAAHCIYFIMTDGDVLLNSARALVGSNRWNLFGTQYNLNDYVMHPDYDHWEIKNDIGFLITENTVVLTNSVRLVALTFDWANAGLETSVTGWGRTIQGGSYSATLQVLNKQVVDGFQCAIDVARRAEELNWTDMPAVNTNLEICTFHSNGRGTCNGDSGGPLMRRDRGEQIGIVSWGLPCARGAPDMYTRISAYRTWIEQNI